MESTSLREKLVDFKQSKFTRIKPLNEEQEYCLKLIADNHITVLLGKSGCGKTHLAAGFASYRLNIDKIDKIIISRAGVGSEDLGYKPGSAIEKIGGYLKGVTNELSQYMDVKDAFKHGTLEIEPIDNMRGMTFKNSCVIIEEVQNCTYDQLKLILTRFGENSKFILTGDISQSDLRQRDKTEIALALKRLDCEVGRENKIVVFEMQTNVRHPLIDIVLNLLEPPAPVY